jgi:hypothetical protein
MALTIFYTWVSTHRGYRIKKHIATSHDSSRGQLMKRKSSKATGQRAATSCSSLQLLWCAAACCRLKLLQQAAAALACGSVLLAAIAIAALFKKKHLS